MPIQVPDYNYYGAYGHPPCEEDTYRQLLSEEYTFDFPPHHSTVSRRAQVSSGVRGFTGGQGRLKEMKALCALPPKMPVRVPVGCCQREGLLGDPALPSCCHAGLDVASCGGS